MTLGTTIWGLTAAEMVGREVRRKSSVAGVAVSAYVWALFREQMGQTGYPSDGKAWVASYHGTPVAIDPSLDATPDLMNAMDASTWAEFVEWEAWRP